MMSWDDNPCLRLPHSWPDGVVEFVGTDYRPPGFVSLDAVGNAPLPAREGAVVDAVNPAPMQLACEILRYPRGSDFTAHRTSHVSTVEDLLMRLMSRSVRGVQKSVCTLWSHSRVLMRLSC